MRLAITCLSIALVAGCSAKQPSSGWKYHRGPYTLPLSYTFDDPDHTEFVGVCIPRRSFSVIGGAWDGSQFTLTVDNKTWTLPTWQGVEGHSLPVDLGAAVQAIASAKHSIVFQVGNWRREIKPAPPLTDFVTDCSNGKLG
jgi:hypothetical protein